MNVPSQENYPDPRGFVPPKPASKVSVPLVLGIVFVVLALACFGAFKLYTASKQTLGTGSVSAGKFIGSLQHHDYSAASEMMLPDAQAATPISSMRNIEELVEKNHGAVKKWTLTNWFIQDYNGTTYLTMTYDISCANTPTRLQLVLQKVNSDYQIRSFQYQL